MPAFDFGMQAAQDAAGRGREQRRHKRMNPGRKARHHQQGRKPQRKAEMLPIGFTDRGRMVAKPRDETGKAAVCMRACGFCGVIRHATPVCCGWICGKPNKGSTKICPILWLIGKNLEISSHK